LKRLALGLFSLVLIFGVLAGCGDDSTKIASDNNSKTTTKKEDSDKNSSGSSQKQTNDIWTYYNNATWSNNYQGFKTTIEKVVVSDKAPAEDGSDKKQTAVGVKFKLENTTKDKFTTYPDQAVLVTSTGEQIDMPSMFGSDNLGGEYDEGVKKEGDVIWYLKNAGTANNIKWVKFKWSIHKGGEDEIDAPTHDYEVKLELKK